MHGDAGLVEITGTDQPIAPIITRTNQDKHIGGHRRLPADLFGHAGTGKLHHRRIGVPTSVRPLLQCSHLCYTYQLGTLHIKVVR